jgi:hypothetical protein
VDEEKVANLRKKSKQSAKRYNTADPPEDESMADN